jgi:hypothetical protein
MEKKILIKVNSIKVMAELNETKTADAIWKALPIKGKVNLWGDEIYFSIPVDIDLESGQDLVSNGDLGYWPPGSAFCIFFGLTPASQGDEIRPASAVTVFGKVTDDPSVFKQVASGREIIIDRENNSSDS